MFIKSHTYMINLDNVNYMRRLKIKNDSNEDHGTLVHFNDGKSIAITCPVDKVINCITNAGVSGIKPNVIKLDY